MDLACSSGDDRWFDKVFLGEALMKERIAWFVVALVVMLAILFLLAALHLFEP